MNTSIIGVIGLALLINFSSWAQNREADTLEIALTTTSKMIISIGDRNDLSILKSMDFQSLIQDNLNKLDESDSLSDPTAKSLDPIPERENLEEIKEENKEESDWPHHKNRLKIKQSFNLDLGFNNYLHEGGFPDKTNAPYAVKTWGSWYLAFNSIQRTKLSSHLFVEWGLGVSVNTFKFEDKTIKMSKDSAFVYFNPDSRALDFKKSKLTLSYVNASLVPVWQSHHNAFRLGLGGYAGYRLGSFSKLSYRENKKTQSDREANNYYLNNLRYGVRLQIGLRSTDLFFNYDLNDLYIQGKGPQLNAFSFGVIF